MAAGSGWSIRPEGADLAIVVENQWDAEAPKKRRNGLGLENVRRRLATAFGSRARMDATSDWRRFPRQHVAPGGKKGERIVSADAQKKIRAVIVDDEELARQMLRELLRAHPEIEIAAECANGFEAVKAVAELKPDLLFLDVQMPKLDGFEVLELTGTDMAIIFTTAYDQYAIRAFEAHAVDYLLKPFGADRLNQRWLALASASAEKLPRRPSSPPKPVRRAQFAERIVVKDGTRVQIIPVGKLDYAEAQDDYVSLCAEGKKHLKQQTISSLEKILDPALSCGSIARSL